MRRLLRSNSLNRESANEVSSQKTPTDGVRPRGTDVAPSRDDQTADLGRPAEDAASLYLDQAELAPGQTRPPGAHTVLPARQRESCCLFASSKEYNRACAILIALQRTSRQQVV